MERQTLLGAVEIRLDEPERRAELATERVAVHESRPGGGVAVGMVERQLEHAQQLRAVLAVMGRQACELLLHEHNRVARIHPLEQARQRVMARGRRRLAAVRDPLAIHSQQPRRDGLELLATLDALAHDGVDLGVRPPVADGPGDGGDRFAHLRPTSGEQELPAPVDGHEPAAA